MVSRFKMLKKCMGYTLPFLLVLAVLSSPTTVPASGVGSLGAEIDRLAAEVEPQVIEWRRDIHKNPELSNREYRTGKLVAEHLQKLGMEVRTGIAKTGVVGVLKGGKPGPVVALRADMDALPVTEQTGLPYASKVNGVMHACGHDTHTAVLMGTAVVLSKIRDQIPGTVKFIFQPAEEGPPEGEEGGAPLMIKEGALENPKPSAIFGLHTAAMPLGLIGYRAGSAMASSDKLNIVVKGSQTHGAMPWAGIDPILVASQIVIGLQSIVSRQTDLTVTPAVISIGTIRGGEKSNIIPAMVEMTGTIRVFDPTIRRAIHEKVKNTAELIAKSAGATAEVKIRQTCAITYNEPALTKLMTPTFQRLIGEKAVVPFPQLTGSEDFSFYQEKIPGLFFFLGTVPPGGKTIPNHSPYFAPDEKMLQLGVRAMSNVAIDYLTLNQGK
jgi:amidohydrolase